MGCRRVGTLRRRRRRAGRSPGPSVRPSPARERGTLQEPRRQGRAQRARGQPCRRGPDVRAGLAAGMGAHRATRGPPAGPRGRGTRPARAPGAMPLSCTSPSPGDHHRGLRPPPAVRSPLATAPRSATAPPPARTTPGAPGKGALPLVGAARPCAGFLAGVVLLRLGRRRTEGGRPAGWPSALSPPPADVGGLPTAPPAGALAPEGVSTVSSAAPTAGGLVPVPALWRGPRAPKTGGRRPPAVGLLVPCGTGPVSGTTGARLRSRGPWG